MHGFSFASTVHISEGGYAMIIPKHMKRLLLIGLVLSFAVFGAPGAAFAAQSIPTPNPGNEGIGMEGRIQQPPPSDAPTISLPADGQVFEEIPVTVTGLCADGLLVRIFKNNVFGGSAMCEGGSYTLQIDLFPGANELVAIQYDDLDQPSPESNRRTVTYAIDVPNVPGSPNQVAQRITLTTNYARRGVDPGKELTWPITISGGRGPYAVSIEWGDGKDELLTRDAAGTWDIKHVYERPGVYRVIIKATDADGESAFLQVVAIVNGAVGADVQANETPTVIKRVVLWQPALILFPLLLTSFWLGKRFQLRRVRYRMKHRIVPIDK